jgi:hypothetical protein
VVTVIGTPGNNTWEPNRRLTTGGASTAAAITGVNSNPKYPNAWCRLQRQGQTFTMFRSDDGVNWVQLGQTTAADWGAGTPMPDTLFVGPEYSPENGNIADSTLRNVWLAKFRDYGDVSAVVTRPTLSFQRTATGLTITYSGTLQSADALTGQWSIVPGATSPFDVVATEPQKFYRAAP